MSITADSDALPEVWQPERAAALNKTVVLPKNCRLDSLREAKSGGFVEVGSSLAALIGITANELSGTLMERPAPKTSWLGRALRAGACEACKMVRDRGFESGQPSQNFRLLSQVALSSSLPYTLENPFRMLSAPFRFVTCHELS